METQLYIYELKEKAFLESLVQIEYKESVVPIRILKNPITQSVPLHVKRSHELTMHDIASNKFLPKSHLAPAAETLYDCIGWKSFSLNTPDFPDFCKAIEYSIATPGLWCHETLKKKAGEFGKPNLLETYLRITLGANNGESPGIPCTTMRRLMPSFECCMEIFVSNCFLFFPRMWSIHLPPLVLRRMTLPGLVPP